MGLKPGASGRASRPAGHHPVARCRGACPRHQTTPATWRAPRQIPPRGRRRATIRGDQTELAVNVDAYLEAEGLHHRAPAGAGCATADQFGVSPVRLYPPRQELACQQLAAVEMPQEAHSGEAVDAVRAGWTSRSVSTARRLRGSTVGNGGNRFLSKAGER